VTGAHSDVFTQTDQCSWNTAQMHLHCMQNYNSISNVELCVLKYIFFNIQIWNVGKNAKIGYYESKPPVGGVILIDESLKNAFKD